MKLTCKTCGTINVAHLDGYSFGDRLLEDVYFEVVVNAKKTKLEVRGVEPSSADYFDSLNTKKWLREAKDYLKAIVSDGQEELICSKCSKHEVIYDGFVGLDISKGVPVESLSATDLIKKWQK